MRYTVKRFGIILSLGIILVTTLASPARAYFEEGFFSTNNILFYDDRCPESNASTSSSGGSATATQSLEEFIDKYGQMAFDSGKKYGLPYEAILAQGALESAYGRSGLTQKANNFFGIKAGSSWTGDVIYLQTGEETPGGGMITVKAAFRKYPSAAEGWDGYGQFITQNPRYKSALSYPGNPEAYLQAIKNAGYATDSQYVAKNMTLVRQIVTYISKTNKWPPSSEVAKTNIPTGGGASSPSTTTLNPDCPASASATGGSTVVGDRAFPLKTTKAAIDTKNGGMFNNGTTSKSGHPYTAYDILADSGTEVVAFLGGTVTDITTDRCPGRMVSIYNTESNITVSYLHMNMNTQVKNGDIVSPGQKVGVVGPPAAGCGTAHLHIDAAQGKTRPGCSRLSCPSANASKFVDIGPDLYNTYKELP